jgi:nitroreductase/dihydropteridine reductase
MNLTKILNTRYSTKSFIKNKKIDSESWSQIEDALRLSASSTNAQPWHFLVTDNDEGKKRLTKGTEKFPFNTDKILGASHVVLFCARVEITDDFLLHVLEKEDQDGRFAAAEFKEQMHGGRTFFVDIHRKELNDIQHWSEKQVYLNVGNALLGAGILGIDALPMEGIDIAALDEEFGLTEKGFTAVVAVAFGYRAEDDFNAKLPKSRLTFDEIITRI